MSDSHAIYDADCLCESCAADIRRHLARTIIDKILLPGMKKMFNGSVLVIRTERQDELEQAIIEICDSSSMDSDDWPSCGHPEEAVDAPSHCGAHAECLEAEVLEDGSKIGKLLGTSLTEHGVAYVAECLLQGVLRENGTNPVEDFWANQFSDYDLSCKMKVKVTDIEYDLDGKARPPHLPKEIVVDVEENPLDNDAISEAALDEVSNITGWAVNGAQFKILDPASPDYPKK